VLAVQCSAVQCSAVGSMTKQFVLQGDAGLICIGSTNASCLLDLLLFVRVYTGRLHSAGFVACLMYDKRFVADACMTMQLPQLEKVTSTSYG
jgi:hypothetical protein